MAHEVKQPHGGTLLVLDPGETANPNGRPPKGFKRFAKVCRDAGYEEVTEREVEDALRLLLQLPMHEIMVIAGNPANEYKMGDTSNEHPAVLRMVANELMNKRGQEMLKQLMDRAFGKATNRQDLRVNGDRPKSPLSALPVSEQAEFLRLLVKANAKANAGNSGGNE